MFALLASIFSEKSNIGSVFISLMLKYKTFKCRSITLSGLVNLYSMVRESHDTSYYISTASVACTLLVVESSITSQLLPVGH